jgi:hypothetical protein
MYQYRTGTDQDFEVCKEIQKFYKLITGIKQELL